ncbi:MAG: ABC transporter substrate-binding protein [Chloroflexota bacterium]
MTDVPINPQLSARSRIRRRDFIRMSGLVGMMALAAACAPAAAPSPEPKAAPKQEVPPTAVAAPKQETAPASKAPAQAASATAEWDKVVDGAQKEGKVAVTTLAGDGYRKILDKFQATYPGVEVEHKSVASASFLAPPVLQEQAGGVFSYDVALLSPGGPIMGSMMPAGAFDDIRPAIIHPDARDDKGWIGGFENCFMDKAKQKVFGVTWDQNLTLFYNSDLVKEKPKSIKDLADPQWKGKLTFMEYQTGFTYIVAVNMNHHMKDEAAEYIKKLFVDQQPVFVREGRQATEALIRGQTAFATGPTPPIIEQFAAEGLGKNVQPVDVPEVRSINMYGVLLYIKAPHPNAAKLLINWLLSKDGGLAVTEHMKFNSRRADVPAVTPSVYPGLDYEKARREFLFANVEEALPLQQQAIEQLKALIVA